MMPIMSPVSDFYSIRSRLSVEFRSTSGFIYDLVGRTKEEKDAMRAEKRKFKEENYGEGIGRKETSEVTTVKMTGSTFLDRK